MSVRRFIKIEFSLFRALSVIKGAERMFLDQMMIFCYREASVQGLHDPFEARISIDKLAARYPIGSSSLYDARASLVATNVLLETGDGFLAINKHFETWTGKHSLSESLIKECLTGNPFDYGGVRKTGPSGSGKPDPRGPENRRMGSGKPEKGVRKTGPSVSKNADILFTNKNRAHARSSEDFKKTEEDTKNDSRFSLRETKTPGGEFSPIPESTPRDPEDQAAITRAINMLDPLRFQNIIDGLYHFCDGPDLRCFEGWRFEAVARRFASGDFLKKSTWKFAYFKKLLADAEPIVEVISGETAPFPARSSQPPDQYAEYVARMLAKDPHFFDVPEDEQ